jgi:hypothetical protein
VADWSVLQVRATVDSEFTNLELEATAKKPRSSLPRNGREGGAKFSRLDMKVLLSASVLLIPQSRIARPT